MKPHRVLRFSLAALSIVAALSLSSFQLLAGSTVTSTTDAALRAAVAGGGLVNFSCDGTIVVTNTITNVLNTILDGSGHSISLSGGNNVRVFCVATNTTLTVTNLTIASGYCTSPGGAGILNAGGTLNLIGTTFSANQVQMGCCNVQGGAVLNLGGTLSASNCMFSGNSIAIHEVQCQGGAVANAGGTATLKNCLFNGNSAGGLWWPVTGTVYQGPNGVGGAIYNDGTLKMLGCTIVSNTATGGMGTAGSPGTGQAGGNGGSGYGGALFNSGTVSLINCTITGNHTGGASGSAGGSGTSSSPYGGNGGAGGNGGSAFGAICSTNGLTMTNCTFAFNDGGAGGGGAGGAGGFGTMPPPHGGNGSPGPTGQSGVAYGGLVTSGAGIVNSVLTDSSPMGNCTGYVRDLGHNLSSDATFTAATSLTNTDPKLGSLANNGGFTPTLALQLGSPAVDAADTASAPATDQRGVPRPFGRAADIGAYELGYCCALQAARSGYYFNIYATGIGAAGRSCMLEASADLVNWLPISTNALAADGAQTLLLRQPTNSNRSFYRAVLY